MKLILLLIIFSTTSFASECKLTAELSSNQKLETVLKAANFEECKTLGMKTSKDNFFGLVGSDDQISNLKVNFSAEEGSRKEVISAEPVI